MTLSYAVELAKPIIRRWEGLRLNAYICPAGVWTIGYGHTQNVTKGMECTQEQAEQWLTEDLQPAIVDANQLCPGLNAYQLAALASFVYNLGAGRLKASTLRRRINAKQWDEVPREFRKWVYGGGKKLPGLVARRDDEIRLWQTTHVVQ